MLTQITTNRCAAGKETGGALSVQDLPIDRGSPIHSLYMHVPFCFHKCHYCDFYSLVDRRERQDAFVERFVKEITASREYLRWPLKTVFAGGGTPTLLAVDAWRRILQEIRDTIHFDTECEFTVEANPETLTDEMTRALMEGGVNRLSIGCQTFDRKHLKTLERWHEPDSVPRSVQIARDAGIDAVNLDVIFAIPGQTLSEWKHDLAQAIELQPEHLSCYMLTFEPNTPLFARMRSGEIVPAPEELQAEMYEATEQTLRSAGYEQYEISNYALSGHECRHNLAYWRNENWWAVGPGASAHVSGVRWKNVPSLDRYLERSPWGPVTDVEASDDDGRVGECFMLGLRLSCGIEASRVDALLQVGTRGDARAAAIEKHLHHGLLEHASGSLRLTRQGRLLADTVLADLL